MSMNFGNGPLNDAASPSPSVITVPGAATSTDDLDTRDLGITEVEAAIRPILDDVRLQWLNGLATTSGMMAIGWHIKAGLNPYLDETCEALMAQDMGVRKYLVQHKQPDKNGKNDPKPYWKLERCSLIVLAEGALSPLQMNRSFERIGIAWGWGPERDEQGQPKQRTNKKGQPLNTTTLKLRVFVHELFANGFYDWLPLTLTGHITDDMLQALYEQYKVLDAYAAYRRAKGLNPSAKFYTFSLPLVPTGQVRTVGEAPNQASIYPMKADLPESIDRAYLAAHLIPEALFREIRDELMDKVMAWSMEETARIINPGANGGEMALDSPASTSQFSAGNGHTLQDQDDPPVLEAHVNWIKQHYCQGNQGVMQAICEKFGVSDLSELRRSHYQLLVDAKRSTAQQ